MNKSPAPLILGVTNLIWAAYSLLGIVYGAWVGLTGKMPGQTPEAQEMMQGLTEIPGYRAFTIVSLALAGAMALFLIAAGVGLLLRKAWGRWLSIGYGFTDIVLTIAIQAATAAFFLPAMLEKLNALPAGPMRSGAIGGAIGGVIGGSCCGLVYPIILLIFMFLPLVKEALDPAAAAPENPA